MLRIPRLLAPLLVGAALAACAATTTAIAKRDLDVQTQMTETVFLDPIPASRRSVFVDVRNTSDKPDLELQAAVAGAIRDRGYTVVDDPEAAHYVLQANVLQAGRSSETAAERAYRGGFGSAIAGGAVGAAAGYGIGRVGGGSDVGLAVAGGLIGAAISSIVDAFVRDTTYTIVSDLQISERARTGLVVTETETQRLPQGGAGSRVQTSSDTTEWKRYRTRIVSRAERVNLDWPEAAPDLVAGLTRSIAGIF
ncbi:MAG TPA: complement resistance protein TraT [Geminicoccaceae bacterium]|nr:complement resistance protein TraT [Geminicoccaceae bacterium]